MFVDHDLMNVWNILEIRKDLDKGYGYIGQLVTHKLSDCCGNPTALGKEVCKFLFE